MFLTNEFFSRNTNSLSISEDVLCKECSSSSLMNKICFNRSLNGRRRLEKEEQVLAKKMLLTQLFCILISYERNWLKVLLFHFRVSKFSHPFASCLCDPSSFFSFSRLQHTPVNTHAQLFFIKATFSFLVCQFEEQTLKLPSCVMLTLSVTKSLHTNQ